VIAHYITTQSIGGRVPVIRAEVVLPELDRLLVNRIRVLAVVLCERDNNSHNTLSNNLELLNFPQR
jgi:hypothetical protein